jgi:hypothetical protein
VKNTGIKLSRTLFSTITAAISFEINVSVNEPVDRWLRRPQHYGWSALPHEMNIQYRKSASIEKEKDNNNQDGAGNC